jgi:hypothetical protein
MSLQYPITKTSVNLNLINLEVLPKLEKSTLLALVKWFDKRRKRGDAIEHNGMGSDSQRISSSIDSPIGSNGCKKIKSDLNRGGEDL